MKFCKEIDRKDVLKTAIKLVEKAKKNINMTMDMKEELRKYLPEIYHEKLIATKNKGIKIRRYLYGDKRLVKKIKRLYPEISVSYQGGLDNYQRMLIIDLKEGIFSINGKVFYSRFVPLIKSLLEYVKIK